MTPGDFLINYLERGSRQITKTVEGYLPKNFMALVELTEKLNFKCEFDDRGICKSKRNSNYLSDEEAAKCCCHGCRACVGFIYELPNDMRLIKRYARHFDAKTGFWRPGKGCVLPRSMRHKTCVTYNCDYNACRSDAEDALMQSIRKGKEFAVTVERYQSEYTWPETLKQWLEEKPTFHGKYSLSTIMLRERG